MAKLSAELSLELVRATALGDQVAFAELYRLTSGKLYAIASRMLGNADAAGEAVQEAYIRVWTQSAQYDPQKGQPIHWMSGIVRHVCIDLLRRSASPPPFGPELDAVEETELPHDIVAIDIERCLRRLDAVQSKAIRMAFHFGLTHAELARALGMPLGTMKSTIRRALAKLKECLDPGDANA